MILCPTMCLCVEEKISMQHFRKCFRYFRCDRCFKKITILSNPELSALEKANLYN
jgi:hypothetical protein